MIITPDAIDARDHDLCVIGAGPVGIALALAAERRGLRVLLIEAGGEDAVSDPALGQAEIEFPAAHASLRDANAHALGGTSHWWGGRCIPFDRIDFESRPWIDRSGWPIGHEDVVPFHAEAAAFFRIGRPDFAEPGAWRNLDGLRFDELERWAPDPNMARVHREALEASPGIDLVLDAPVVDLVFSPDRRRVERLVLAQGGERHSVTVRRLALACGGTGTMRVLLTVQQRHPDLFGGRDGPLGRCYMGHNFGKIADLVLDRPGEAAALDFFLDDGRYGRRRFTFPEEVQREHSLLQTSYAAGNARISDPAHRSGALSLIWLALASPLGKRLLPDALLRIYVGEGRRRWGAHIGNVVRTALPTALAAGRIYHERYRRRPGKPAVFLHSAGGRYTIHYHAEQSPDPANRLTVGEQVDRAGWPSLHIRFAYAREDAEAIVRGHRLLDAALRRNGIGRLEFATDDDAALADEVLAQARDGMHQIGGARMSRDPAEGVVDADCRVHGLDNLFVASSAVFPTSGQANPTFMATALAIRLADHLSGAIEETGDQAVAANASR